MDDRCRATIHPGARCRITDGYRNVTATWAPAAPGRTQPPSTESRTKDVLLPPGPHSLVEKRTQCASHRHGHRTSGHSWLQASHRATSLGWGTTKKPRQARSGSIPPARCVHMVSYLLISKSWMGSASFSHRKGNITDANALPRDCYIPRKYDKHPQRQKWKGDRKKVPAPPDPFIHTPATQPCQEIRIKTPAFPLFFFASVLCLTTGEKDRDRPRFSTRPAATDGPRFDLQHTTESEERVDALEFRQQGQSKGC
jgi:hypothetical protein